MDFLRVDVATPAVASYRAVLPQWKTHRAHSDRSSNAPSDSRLSATFKADHVIGACVSYSYVDVPDIVSFARLRSAGPRRRLHRGDTFYCSVICAVPSLRISLRITDVTVALGESKTPSRRGGYGGKGPSGWVKELGDVTVMAKVVSIGKGKLIYARDGGRGNVGCGRFSLRVKRRCIGIVFHCPWVLLTVWVDCRPRDSFR